MNIKRVGYCARNWYMIPAIIAALCTLSFSVSAADGDNLTFFERLVSARPMISPSTSVATPVAFGVGWGTVFVGVTGQTGTTFSGQPFGSYAAGFGLGDANRYVALTTTVTSGGLDEVTRDGNLNFQVSRNLFPDTAIAVGVENVAPWGADRDNKMNTYLVASKVFSFCLSGNYTLNVIGTLGAGNSRFVQNFREDQDHNDVNTVRPFGSVGILVLPQAALMIDYVGLTWNAGISAVPFQSFPIVVSVSAEDLTNRGGNHIPIVGAIGYSWTFA